MGLTFIDLLLTIYTDASCTIDLFNKGDLKNEEDLKTEDILKNQNNLKNKENI